jgi:hypothetical protein
MTYRIVQMNIGSVRRALVIAITCLFLVASGMAVRQLVIIEEPQPARHVEGIVVDPSGAPIPDMTVTDCDDQWDTILRTTKTDSKGHFHFSSQPGKAIYYLHFENALFNPLQLKLTLDKKSHAHGIVVKAPIGG